MMGALAYLLTNAAAEGSEEGASDLINWIADVIVAGDKGEWRTAVRDYELHGMSESEAFGHALADKAAEIGLDVLGGALSGGIMATPGTVSRAVNNRRTRAAERAAEVQQEESTAIDTNEAGHTPEERRVIEEYQGAVDPGLVDFYNNAAQSDVNVSGSYRLKDVSDRAAAEVKRILGRDVSGFRTVFEARQARHISNDHGANGRSDRTMADANDVGRIQYVLDNFDTAEYGGATDAYRESDSNGRQRKAPTVVFTKKVDGTYFVVEAAPITKAKAVNIVTAYMLGEGKTPPGGRNKTASEILQAPNAKAPGFTANTEAANVSLAENSVSRTQGVVNEDEVQKKKEPTDTTHHAGNDSALDAYVRNVPPSGSFDDSISQSAQNVNTEQARPTAQTLSDEITRQWDSAEERSATSQERSGSSQERSSTSSEPMPLTVGEEFSRRNRAALARSEVERTGILAGARDEDISAAERISRAVGRKVLFYSSNSTQNKAAARANGYYKGGVIYVNAESGNPVAQIISHELTHSLEGSKLYSQLSDMVLSRMSESGVNVEDARKQKAALYERSGAVLEDNAAVDRELVAEYIEKHLLHDEDAVIRMVRENRGLAVRIRNWLDSLLAKLGSDAARERAFVRRAINLYARALDDAENVTGRARRRTVDARARADAAAAARAEETAAETSRERLRQAGERLAAGEISEEEYDREAEQAEPLARERELRETREYGQDRTKRQAARTSEKNNAAREGGETRYAIKYDRNNTPYVVVEEDILAGVPRSEWVRTVKDNLRKKFPNGVVVGSHQIEIDGQSRREMTYSGYMQWLFNSDPQIYADKLRATGNADEILLAATNWIDEGLRHPRKDRIASFARGNVLLRIGGNDYRADVVVGTRRNGTMLLYDLLNLQRTSIMQKETGAATSTNPSPGAARNTATISEDSISENGEDVNPEFSISEDSEGRELSEEQQEFFRESKVRDEEGRLLLVYHGTDAEFTVFDRSKGRSSMDIQGSFFSPWEIDAGGYGPNVRAYYLNIKNPAPESVAYRALDRFKSRNYAGVLAREYLEAQGYDGVDNSGEEYIAFYPEQIKLADNRNPTSDPDIRYSISEEETERGIQEVAGMKSVADVSGKTISLDRPELRQQVADFFRSVGGTANNPQLGAVILNERGIRSDLAHGMGQEKAASFAAVPDIIENGRVVDYRENWKNRRYDTAVIAAPITIDGAPYMAGVILRRAGGENRFYVHEVITENGASPFNRGGPVQGDLSGGDTPSINSILQRILTVKRSSEPSGEYSISEDSEGHELSDGMPEWLHLPSPEDEDISANTEFIDLPTQEDVDAPRGPRYEAERIPMPEDRDAPDASYRRKKLSTRARSYFNRAMQEASDTVAARLGVPEGQVADTVGVTLDALADMYMTDGTLDENTVEDAFETVYNSVTIIDGEFYEMYKPVRKYLRETTVYVSDAVKNEFTDWGSFRKSVGSRIKIRTGEGAASAMAVDEVYSELSQTWPELFPVDISVPSSQLERMDEVYRSIERVEKTLDEAAGESSGEVKQAARHDFNEAVYDLVSRLKDVRNFERSREVSRTAKDAKEAENRDRLLRNAEARGLSEEEAARLYKTSRAQFAAFSKAKALNLLTESDRLKLGQLLRGEIQTDALDAETDNVRGITAVYEAARAYEDTMTALRGYEQSRAAALRDEAAAMLEGAEKWHDKSKGYLYARETAERNVRDVVGDDEKAKEIIDTYFTPVHKNEAESTKMKNRLRDTVRELNLSRRVKKGNSMSEAAMVQFVGEAEDNIAVLSTGVNARDPQAKRGGMTLEEWRGALENAWKENPNLDRAKVENAVEKFRELYDKLFRMINEARVRNGYEPISYRRGYFPHFQSEKRSGVLGWLGKAFGVQTEVTNLPTTINGRTEDFKPGIRWMGAALERKGNATDFDAVEGFDRYLEVAADVIWHTDDIQRLRALATATRERTTDESIAEYIEKIRQNDTIDEQEKQTLISEKRKEGRYELSNFAGWLDEYTNLLAGKKSRADRQMEADAGRGMYNVLKALESRVGANMVGFNVRSATTNFIPITQGWADLGGGTVLRGMWDTLKAHSPRAKFMQAVKGGGASIGDIIEALSDNMPLDNFSDMSEFLTNRRGSERLVQTRTQEIVGKTPLRMARDLMETVDRFSSETLVRARYAQNVKRGLSEQSAMDEADAWAAGVMAARSKGSMPTLFSRANPLTKLFTQFQLEVNNQFSYLMKDVPREHREKGMASLAWALLKFAIGAWLFNELSELITGYRPALDPIGILNDTVGDLTGYELPNVWSTIGGVFTGHLPSLEETKKEGVYGAGKNLAKNVAEELPFVGGLLGGGRIPISSAVPNPVNLWSAATNTDWAPEKRWQTARKELTKPLTYLLPPAGGGAVQRAIEGAATSAAGGSYTVNSKGEDILQYPEYTDEGAGSFWDVVKSMIMGKSSLDTAQDWVRSGFDSLSAKQTTAYREMTDAGMGQRDAFELLREIEGDKMTKTEKMRAVVNATDIEEARLAAMKTVLTKAAYDKVAAAGEFGVSSESWTELMETLPDYDDGNGSYTQAEVTAALDDMSWLTREEKAVLWQAQAKNWTAKKNPYDKELGEEVADRLNREEEEEEMPEWVSLPTP